MFRAIKAITRKDCIISLRNPVFLIFSIVLPLIFVSFYSLMIYVSTTNPIAISKESDGLYSDRLIEILKEMGNDDGKYFEIKTLDPQEAQTMYRNQSVSAMLVIPKSFDQDLRSGKATNLNLRVYNINSDDTKNFRLRVDHASYLYQREFAPELRVQIQEKSIFPRDIPIKRYLATALLMFSVVYAGLVNTSTLFTREWEERTVKSIILSPFGHIPFIVGKWVSAFTLTLVSLAFTLLTLYGLLDYPFWRMDLKSWFNLLLFFLYGASLGTFLGAVFQRSLPIIPFSVVIALSHFFINGYESYIRGFAHGGTLEWLWRTLGWFPLSSLTDTIRFSLEGFESYSYDWTALILMVIIITFFTGGAVIKLRRRLKFAQGQ